MPVNDVSAVRRAATRAWLEDQERVDELLELLANGESLRDVCNHYDLVYPTTMRFLAKNYRDEYEAAKQVRADTAIDEMAEVEGELRDGKTDFNTARELFKSKQWRAERLNPGRYSPKQTVDMQVTDKTRLHLEAIRALSRTTQALPPRPSSPAITQSVPQTLPVPVVVDAEFVEVKR